jgi:hypothetical protein
MSEFEFPTGTAGELRCCRIRPEGGALHRLCCRPAPNPLITVVITIAGKNVMNWEPTRNGCATGRTGGCRCTGRRLWSTPAETKVVASLFAGAHPGRHHQADGENPPRTHLPEDRGDAPDRADAVTDRADLPDGIDNVKCVGPLSREAWEDDRKRFLLLRALIEPDIRLTALMQWGLAEALKIGRASAYRALEGASTHDAPFPLFLSVPLPSLSAAVCRNRPDD